MSEHSEAWATAASILGHDPFPFANPSSLLWAQSRVALDNTTANARNSLPPTRPTSPPSPSLFTVTTDCDIPSTDEEEESSAATLADRYRRDRMPPPYSSSSDTEDGGLSRWVISRARAMGLPSAQSQRRSRRRAAPSRIEIVNDAASYGNDSKTKGVLMPHARFFIEREKSMISIKFDPPMYVPPSYSPCSWDTRSPHKTPTRPQFETSNC